MTKYIHVLKKNHLFFLVDDSRQIHWPTELFYRHYCRQRERNTLCYCQSEDENCTEHDQPQKYTLIFLYNKLNLCQRGHVATGRGGGLFFPFFVNQPLSNIGNM